MKNKFARIKHIESYKPKILLDNIELNKAFPEWNVDKIAAKTGIENRYIADENETALDLAVVACNQLFDSGVCKKEDIDCLIFCTQSPDYVLPPNSCLLQDRLGLSTSIKAFDYTHGCSGYVYGLHLAKALIESGQSKNILFVTGDTYSRYINPKDRSVRPLFGDGATATFISAEEAEEAFIDHFIFSTDGRGLEALLVPVSGTRKNQVVKDKLHDKVLEDGMRTLENLYMNGREVYTYTLRSLPPLVSNTLEKANLMINDIDHFVFHQANAFMLESLRQKCEIPNEKFHLFLKDCGNTGSSSIPFLLANYMKQGRIKAGDKMLLAGFGVGYASALGIITV
ncbi:ketoacyl-ACP synthase III [Desulfovibrio litoralis]|nr:ketoacyl-ACP synthase III [Desulfovibrio litoralis]